jgi:hypothetical protein
MKKQCVFLVIFIMLMGSGWSNLHQVISECTEIQCEIKKIDRSKIHPKEVPFTSANWSGYVAAPSLSKSVPGSVSLVTGSWTVPKLEATYNESDCAIWVGIDGFQDASVEQIGTSHNWVKGAQENYAWFEMYPNPSYEINGFPANAGDLIEATVKYEGNNTFKMTLSNHTRHVKTTIPVEYTKTTQASRRSAEWIVEAPFLKSILPLSDFKVTGLKDCFAMINGIKGPINDRFWVSDVITMKTSHTIKAKPSLLLDGGKAFNVTWVHE